MRHLGSLFDGKPVVSETTTRVHIRGLVTIESLLGKNKDVALTRAIFPSTTKPLVLERYTFTNHSAQTATVEAEDTVKTVRTSASRGVAGSISSRRRWLDPGPKTLKPGESASFTLAFSAREAGAAPIVVNAEEEEKARRERVDEFLSKLQLETPDPVLNTAFALCQDPHHREHLRNEGRADARSRRRSRTTPPIWANDQAEYANPFFPFLGDRVANEAAINSYRLFARYMNPDFKPIPSSIIAEGTGFWNGAGDRGDMAMIAYGASGFALAYGDRKTAEELWQLIAWCSGILPAQDQPARRGGIG